MRTTRCLASLMVSITALFMVGCSADAQEAAFCDMPAPLEGQFDPSAPGYLFAFHQGVNATDEVERLASEYPIDVSAVYDAWAPGGFAASMSEETMQQIRCELSIERVEYNASGGIDIQATRARASSSPSL